MKPIGLIRGFLCWIALTLAAVQLAEATEFFCASGDVTCLIAAINEANETPGEHVVNLEPGIYTLQVVDNGTLSNPNGLPVISGSIRIQPTAEDIPTIIERDPNGPSFRIFEVSVEGKLSLEGVILQRGRGSFGGGPAILNRGITSLHNSMVTKSSSPADAAISNSGTLRLLRSSVFDNSGGPIGGAVFNTAGATVLVENSTIANNFGVAAGGITNLGSLLVKNSVIIFNSTDGVGPGGGINNIGTAEIVNTTIAQNNGGFAGGGGGLFNRGQVSITNSTIRENTAGRFNFAGRGGGISNNGTLQIHNTIVAGNTLTLLVHHRWVRTALEQLRVSVITLSVTLPVAI